MLFPRFTIVGLLLAAISIGLCLFHFFTHPVWDARLIASILSLISFGLLIWEFKQHAGHTQIFGIILSLSGMGMSIDHTLPYVPFISISLLFSLVSYKKFFREWFSETTLIWIDPFLFVISFSCYVYGNLHYEYGWKGWAFPLLPLVVNTCLGMMDFVFSKGAMKYISEKKLIHEAGVKAPDFCLNDYEGKEVKLSDYSGKRDVLLMFVRNAWCPSCHIMLRTYQRNSEKFNNKNVLLCAIGPNDSDVNRQMAIDLGIDFKILSDDGQKTAMAYRVHLPSEMAGGAPEGMPLPASFLIDKKGIIRYTSRPDKIGEFFAPETIFPILDALN